MLFYKFVQYILYIVQPMKQNMKCDKMLFFEEFVKYTMNSQIYNKFNI